MIVSGGFEVDQEYLLSDTPSSFNLSMNWESDVDFPHLLTPVMTLIWPLLSRSFSNSVIYVGHSTILPVMISFMHYALLNYGVVIQFILDNISLFVVLYNQFKSIGANLIREPSAHREHGQDPANENDTIAESS